MKKLFLGLIALITPVIPQALASDQGDYYVRMDAGYGQTKLRDISQRTGITDLSGTAKGFVGSLGMGYYLSSNIRVELQAYYDNGLKAKANSFVSQSRKKTMAGFVNFGCDFLPTSSVTPYIIGGVGYAQNRFDLTKNFDTNDNPNVVYKITKKGKRGVVFQGGAGISYSFTENFALDLSYRIINNMNSKKKTCASLIDPTDLETCKSNLTQGFLGGIRYTF